MSDRYARELLRRNVAQICQTIGWNGIQSTPLDVLVHVLEKYIRTLGSEASRYAENFDRTEPNLHDLGLVFRDLHVHLPELTDYVRSVPPAPCPLAVEPFPHPKESNLNFLKPGSHEVVTRPMHVHEHLPPMYPEREQTPPVVDTVEIQHNGHDASPEISVTDSPEKDPFKRPPDPSSLPPSKRPRIKLEEEECHTREISSVMMTMSGFLSPAREGKLPEAKTPAMISERHPDKHKTSAHRPAVGMPHTLPSHLPLERSDKKSKKSRVNGKIVKSKRRDKSHKSESSKSRHDRMDRLPPDLAHRSKEVPILHHNNATMPAPRVVPPTPELNNIRPIKQEPLDYPPPPTDGADLVKESKSIPIPRKIPIAKSPLVPSASSTYVPRNVVPPEPILQPIDIKQEIIDEEEKLASQPDRSKLSIFKRISNKSKEEKPSLETNDKLKGETSTSRVDEVPQNVHDKNSSPEIKVKPKASEHFNNNSQPGTLDISKHMDLTTNEVINIDDDSLDMNPPFIKREPDLIPTPVPIAVNKLKQLPYPKEIGISPKVKKDRKHKDKRDKVAEKAAKINTKLIKKQKQQLAAAMVAQSQGFMPQSAPVPLSPKIKPPKMGRQSKDASKFPQMPPGFPFFHSLPPRGLMSGPGLIPNPLIPGNDLYAGLTNNPALRGLPPNLLANPFAMAGNPGLKPGTSFYKGPGLIPPELLANFRNPNISQPRFPLLRRPSLEVIPVENDEPRKPLMSQISPMREKDKNDKHKVSSIPNILQKHSPQKSRIPKDHLQKSNAFKMPTVTPDITIELNPPAVKSEPVKSDPPSPVLEVSPAPKTSIPDIREPEIMPETSITEIPKEKIKENHEKKKDKLHKKEKKDKEGIKIKKKKDKKDKNKLKDEKRKDKEDKVEKGDKIKKEKKDKKKEKEKPPSAVDALVPKLTLRLGSSSPMAPSSPDPVKINIKPIKKEPDPLPVMPKEERTSRESSRSPELAQISALVTRPPKPKGSRHNHVSSEQSVEVKQGSPPPQSSNNSPSRKNRPPSSHSKYRRILIKPLAKRSNMDEDSPIDLMQDEPPAPRPNADKSAPTQLTTPYYTDEHGNKVWVCPACGRPDNGSPMIGCDGCDCWYHWVCVGITVDPGVSEDWFCKSCMAKRAAMVTALAGVQTGRKRGRKPKAERVKDGQ